MWDLYPVLYPVTISVTATPALTKTEGRFPCKSVRLLREGYVADFIQLISNFCLLPIQHMHVEIILSIFVSVYLHALEREQKSTKVDNIIMSSRTS